jgi:hypothetical protein
LVFNLLIERLVHNEMVELLVQNWNQLLPYFKRMHYVFEE